MIAMLKANKQNNPRLVNKHSIKICGLCFLCTSFSAMKNLLAITRIFLKENHIIDYKVNDLPFPSLLYKLCQPDLLQCNGRLPLDCFHEALHKLNVVIIFVPCLFLLYNLYNQRIPTLHNQQDDMENINRFFNL